MSQAGRRPTFQEIDTKWQLRWAQERQAAKPHPSKLKPKFYVLPMFAYPSGSLHMGHLRVYTISDVIARYRRQNGYNVLHPTGWDAFGLPAENAAIERGIDPATWTEKNIATMKEQLKRMNTQFDWDREFSTCSPSFYKHTQKIFLMLLNRGLVYQAEAVVNWDPVDNTVLANEQVDSSGRSWRSGALVKKINLKQWFFRITAFRGALLNDLQHLRRNNSWPERVLVQQSNWLGRSQGATIPFHIKSNSREPQTIHVFTTRPDTLFGVTYLALSMSHPIVEELAQDLPQLQMFLSQKSSFLPNSKEGFRLSSISAINPLASVEGYCSTPLPVYVAPYVLEEYGEGAVMGVPAHDARDLAFWKTHQPDAPTPLVVTSGTAPANLEPPAAELQEAIVERGTLTGLCGRFAGLESADAGEKIIDLLSKHKLGSPTETWRLRDWLVSRQRYWGTPIPIVHCPSCGAVPVSESELPIELPKLDGSIQKTTGNPLDKIESWVNTRCPKCHGPAKRETDTMDTFVDSSWYYLRFPDVHNEKELFSPQSTSNLPVDTYIGGVEHAILHLLYARFIYKFLASEGLIAHEGIQEPFSQLIAQGMVHGKTFSDPKTGRFLLPHEIQVVDTSAKIIATGETPAVTWEKMSKSKHNGVDPITCIERYGADATRAHILFAAPISEILQWDDEKIVGIQRWFHRISRLVSEFQDMSETSLALTSRLSDPEVEDLLSNLTGDSAEVFLLSQNTVKSVTRTFEQDIYGLNTTISDLIKLTNGLVAAGLDRVIPWVAYESLTTLLRMLAPIAPAFAEQSWEDLHTIVKTDAAKSVLEAGWPEHMLHGDLEARFRGRMETTMTCAVQINGKLRFTAQVPVLKNFEQEREAAKSALMESILATEEGTYWLTQKYDLEKVKRLIVAKDGRLVSLVF